MQLKTLEVNVNISIRNYQGGDHLSLNDTVQIPEVDFLGVAKILEGFHNLAIALKKAEGDDLPVL